MAHRASKTRKTSNPRTKEIESTVKFGSPSHLHIDYVSLGKTLERLSPVALAQVVEDGIPVRAYHNVAEATGLSQGDLAEVLGVSTRYLQNKDKDDLLNTTSSERLVQLANIWNLGLKVFGDKDELRSWLIEPSAPLEGKTPMELMTNAIGMEEVEQLLGRIQHGVYS